MRQRTISRKVDITGIGLHSGKAINVSLEPLGNSEGIIFKNRDTKTAVPLNIDNIIDTKLATTVGLNDTKISTIEHFLSAVSAYGIDNLLISIDGPEMPILDGSAIGFCMLLEEAGVEKLTKSKEILIVKKEVCVNIDKKSASLSPSDATIFDFTIDFNHPSIGKQNYLFNFSTKSFKKEIAKARTFGFLHEVQYLRSKNLALGGSLENAVVLDENRVLNTEGLRYKDEFVRHKILDAIGDLALLNRSFLGKYSSYAGSHHINYLLNRELLKDSNNYELIKAKEIKDFKEAYAKDRV